ncbi:hypothetical protein [Pantanalinema sp. GBBB05]|uniref:hypothetical protein n=1 Tax=Pantanalinema sp. GBBB05 TaxID=2604139 RepID=UPI001DFAF3AE|nr:hypothetical protein [Pantanalinema sp. GBBB05]
MNILVENLFRDNRELIIPGFFIRSTAPDNVEDEDLPDVDIDQPTIQDIIEILYQNSAAGSSESGLVIAIHGYNTGADGSRDGVLEDWYQPLCTYINQDSFVHQRKNSSVFLGYRWPSESLKRKNIRKEALSALPVLMRLLAIGGLLIAIVGLFTEFFTATPAAAVLTILGTLGFAIVASLFLLRISVYFRDSYRATYFGVPDLVELIRQLDQGLVNRKMSETLTEDSLYEKITTRIPATQTFEQSALLGTLRIIRSELSKRSDLRIDVTDAKFQYFLQVLKKRLPLTIDDPTLIEVITRIIAIEGLAYSAAQEYWQTHQIKLSFIGHSMGGHVTSQVIRVISDVFDSRSVGTIGTDQGAKFPSSRVGRVFTLGRLVLVSPDIPLMTVTSGRANFLRSALRRFEEAYLFSNEGDLALRIASTAANYFSFPARSRTQGYRLGNLTVHSKHQETKKSKKRQETYGIVNWEELPNPHHHLLPYLEVSVLNKDKNQSLDPASQKQEGNETVASEQQDEESIADLFTYLDCTEYCDKADYYSPNAEATDNNILILNQQKTPLNFWEYVNLFIAYATFAPNKFPKQGRDVHGGYFWGKFSKLIMYRLAFVGFQGLLDSLIFMQPDDPKLQITQPLPEDLKTDLAAIQQLERQQPAPLALEPIDPVLLKSSQREQLKKRRAVALRYFSWICQQKRIQVAMSPERYQVDILVQDHDVVREMMLSRDNQSPE